MPFRVLHFEGEAFAVVELSGVVRWPEVAGALRTLYLHPRWVPGSDVIWDATALTSVDIAPDDLADVRAAFEEVAAARAGGRTAFLASVGGHDELWALLPRLGPPSTRRVEVFHRRADALAYLGRTAMPEGGVVAA